MRFLLFGLLAAAIILAGCSSGPRGSAACKDNTQCMSWQFCNQTSGSCATLPGYCDNDAACEARDNMTRCDLENTHLCIFKAGLCRTDANCQNWQVCTANQTCRAAPGYCDSDSQCDPVFEFCNPSTHKCGPAPGFCTSDTDCDSWEKCDVVSKRCFILPGRCELDGDCENWQACDPKTHYCEAKPGYCKNDEDCPPHARCEQATKKCIARQGYCIEDNECNEWEFCSEQTNRCTPSKDRCGADSDCGTWQICDSGNYCQARLGYCDDNGDCVQGEVCNQQTHICQ